MSDQFIDYERLIVRRLDGAITEEEALELDRALLRDPELRRTLEAYESVDMLAAQALSSEISDRANGFDASVFVEPRREVRVRRAHRGWLLLPGAIAAALLALVIPSPNFDGGEPSVATQQWLPSAPMVDYAIPSVVDYSELMHNVNATQRGTGRDIIGVITEDGNVYWIEVDHTRTISFPGGGSQGIAEPL